MQKFEIIQSELKLPDNVFKGKFLYYPYNTCSDLNNILINYHENKYSTVKAKYQVRPIFHKGNLT